MHRPLLSGLLAILVTPLACAAADSGARQWSIAPREAWVQAFPAPAAAAGNAAAVLLHDRQIRIGDAGDERYEHRVRRLSAAQVVEDGTRVDVPLDPRFQELVIHSLRLTAAGGPARAFTPAEIRGMLEIQPREAEPRKRELDPQLQISIQVPQVHAGDVLEVEYTVHSRVAGIPGALAGHYAAQWPCGGDEPVAAEHLHVSWPSGRTVQYRLIGVAAGAVPQIVSRPGELDLQWRNLRPPVEEPDTPRWFISAPAVQLSDFADWPQVAALLAPEYAAPVQTPGPPAERLERPAAPAGPAVILKALQLVQSQVQVANVTGDRPYVPADPALVLRRGYGDSRDIARLLVMRLRRIGVDAQVGLASSRGVLLDSSLPAPSLLDSAVVLARAGGTDYWLNPAAPGPAAALATRDPGDLRSALLISATGGRLVTLPRPDPDSRLREVTQQFDLRAGNSRPAALTVTTLFGGSWSQAVRAQLLAQSPQQLLLTQIQGVAQDYPDATADGAVRIADLAPQGELQLQARFRIPRPFGADSDPQFSFFAEALADAVQPRDEATRQYPLALPWPLHLEQHIVAALPHGFTVPQGRLIIANPAFRYAREVRLDHDIVQIDHSYVALADHVDPAGYAQFLQASAQVYRVLGVRAQRAGLSGQRLLQGLGSHGFGIAAVATLVVLAVAGWRRLRRSYS